MVTLILGRRDTNAKGIVGLRKDFPYYTLFFCSIETCIFLFPCVILLLIYFDPCIPPFPKWWLGTSSSCSSTAAIESNVNSRMKLLVSSMLTFYVLVNLVASAALALLYGPLGMMFAFLSHLDYIKNRSQFKRISLQPLHRRIIMYRGLQLLVGLFNDCYQWVFFTVLLFIEYFIISVNLFIFVRLHREFSSATSFLLGSITVEGFFCIIILNSLSGKVYQSSCSLLTAWSRNSSSEKSRCPKMWVKRTIRSCQGIKIRIGSVNFIDRLTPFVICGFCVRLALRLSLAVKK
jgi:hypothetical protein